MVVDHETWIMDLQEANRHNVDSPRWYRLYTAREAFRMPSLTPQDWDHLVHRMTYDDNLFQTYYKYKNPFKFQFCFRLTVLYHIIVGTIGRRHLCGPAAMLIARSGYCAI
jgi:hypothetical protein